MFGACVFVVFIVGMLCILYFMFRVGFVLVTWLLDFLLGGKR